MLTRIHRRLSAREDIASLVYFRVVFGSFMLWEVIKYLLNDWVGQYWVEPTVHFSYFGFGWVRPLPGPMMYWLWAALGLLSVCILIGLAYRLSAALFFLGFTYTFLLEQTRYLNHFYLISLVAFLMIFVPCHRRWSVDAWLRPQIRTDRVTAYPRAILLGQFSIVYFYGGLAKIDPDWLAGAPVHLARLDLPLVGAWVGEKNLARFIAYAGLAYDLTIPALLLWGRTRWLALAASVVFHVANSVAFRIGIFPWFMLASSALYFPPDWPRRLFNTIALGRSAARAAPAARCTSAVMKERSGANVPSPIVTGEAVPPSRWLVAGAAAYFAWQLAVPLRHVLYPGRTSWTEEGHKFSWRMKLRDKRAEVQYVVVDPRTRATRIVKPRDYLPDWQYRRMAIDPALIAQHARQIATTVRDNGRSFPEVRALAIASLNGRKPQLLIDPTTDLARQEASLAPARWIVPLEHLTPSDQSGARASVRFDGDGVE